MAAFWHVASDHDCISSIAARYGFLWETLWNHPSNSDLKTLHKDPNVLFAGDRVFIPDRQPRLEDRATDQTHTFVRKGVPIKLRLFLRDTTEPRANLRYVLVIDGVSHEGTTDEEGMICVDIPPGALEGVLTVFDGDMRQSYRLKLGAMDPGTEDIGLVKRLRNLGFLGPDEGRESLQKALRAFQLQQGLPITGNKDDADTIAALKRVHAS